MMNGGIVMSKKLVVYFSVNGDTREVALKLANVVNADVHEIMPQIPYTNDDLNWMNKKSRTSVEMSDKSSRPAIENKVENMEQYDTIYIGFPIWWYVAPTIINTFLESYNMEGKTIIPFATSGGSGMGNTNKELQNSCKGAILKEGQVFSRKVSEDELREWISNV